MIRLLSRRSAAAVILAGVTVVGCGRKPAAGSRRRRHERQQYHRNCGATRPDPDGESGAARLQSGHRDDRARSTSTVTSRRQVIPAISGPVSRMLVEPGDAVRPGQALALVASPDFAADVAAYRKAETAWRNAQRIATLDEKLFASDALPRAELDQARSDLAAAEADREAALQQLSSLGDRFRLDRRHPRKAGRFAGGQAAIRAPIAGTVVETADHAGPAARRPARRQRSRSPISRPSG